MANLGITYFTGLEGEIILNIVVKVLVLIGIKEDMSAFVRGYIVM